MRFKLILGAITILAFLFTFQTVNAQIDSLVMKTGEVLVGEIKSLSQGIIEIETEYSDDDFTIEWEQVKYIQTERKYIITMSNGDRYNGMLMNPNEVGKVLIRDKDEGDVVARLLDVVYMKSVEDNFLSRIDLLMSVGYSLTKANESHQVSARLNAGYLSNTFGVDLYFSAVTTIQTPDSTTIRTDRTEGGIGFRFFIYKDWFALVGNDLLQSTEQKLTLRSLTKGGIGNYIVNTNRMYFVLAGGAAWNYEDYNDPTISDRNSAEAFAALEYNIFDIGDLDLKTNIDRIPKPNRKRKVQNRLHIRPEIRIPTGFLHQPGVYPQL